MGEGPERSEGDEGSPESVSRGINFQWSFHISQLTTGELAQLKRLTIANWPLGRFASFRSWRLADSIIDFLTQTKSKTIFIRHHVIKFTTGPSQVKLTDMKRKWNIRKATKNDIETIASFNEAMALETEGKILDPKSIRNGVTRLMDRSDLGFYLVAEHDGVIAGSLMITFEWTDWRDGLFWWIQSVFVLPEHRRSGVFRAMYKAVEDLSGNEPDVRGIRLYVEQENAIAQNTYETMGMNRCHYVMYEKEF